MRSLQGKPGVHPAMHSAATGVGSATIRPRPLIYIYNEPLKVNSHVLQYRENKQSCTWRRWYHASGKNMSDVTHDAYGVEYLLPELLMGSHHRTINPEEADYFFVPVLPSCYMTHVAAQHDFPWFSSAT